MIYTTKKQALEAIAKNPMNLQYASDELKNNRAVVVEAVKKDPTALRYASDRLKRGILRSDLLDYDYC